jgi:hypothetical protein
MNAFQVAPLLLLTALAACRTSDERAVDIARDKTISCLRHAAQGIAPEPVDLPTAVAATMKRAALEVSRKRDS